MITSLLFVRKICIFGIVIRKECKMDAIKGQVLTVQESKFQDGTTSYQLGVLVNNQIGFVWSRYAYKPGAEVYLGVRTNKDHKFVVGVVSVNG